MSCPECGWPEPSGRCSCCGKFIRPTFRTRDTYGYDEEDAEPLCGIFPEEDPCDREEEE